MKVKVSTIPPEEEKESAGGDQKNTKDSKRKRAEQSISDVQLHQIKPKMLRTTANNFFGTALHSNSSPMSSSDGSRTPREAGETKSRSQLMQSLDPIVMSFNAADFETLAKSIRAICSKDVALFCKLIPDAITDDDEDDIIDIDEVVFPEAPAETGEIFHHHLSGVSALLLLWVLLQETHPDAVMQIIDRRICYRQVLPTAVTESAVDFPPTDTSAKTSAARRSAPAAAASRKVSTPPVSIIEAVLKFSGSCITTHSLDAIFADLSRRSGVLLPSGPGSGPGSGSSTSASASASSDSAVLPTDPATAVVVGDGAGLKLNPNALAEFISNYLTHEAWRDPPGPSADSSVLAAAVAVASAVPPVMVATPTITRPHPISIPNASSARTAEALGSLQETSRKYLADVRLVFSEHDLVTRFEFNIRAAEDFALQGP